MFLTFFLTTVFAHAAATLTLDGGQKVKQGETFTVNVNLTNENAVSGIEMKISLPKGLSFVGTEEDGEMVYGEATDRSSASFSGATLNGSTLTVAFLATASKNRIKSGSGSILMLTIKADDDAPVGIGKIKLHGMEIAYPGTDPENPADKEYDCNIYNIFTVTATSANAEMGSVTGGGTFDSGTTITLTATATEGYHFVKWSNDVTDNPYSFTVTGATQLTASFAPNQYKMTFVLDNGEDDIVKTLDYKSELKAPDNITKKGHSFTGWNPEVPTTVPLGDQSYTAQWKVNQYTMTFVLGNGEQNVVITQDYGTSLVAPTTPVRNGYNFVGWTPAVDATIPAENKTFTAQWELGTYTITYDLAGGSLGEGITNPESYTIESDAITLNNPTQIGYTFAGWTGTGLTEATKSVTIAKGSTGNRSYKATWTPTAYAITYDLAGGSLGEGITNPESYTIESDAVTLNNPTRTGYAFSGWTGTGLEEPTTTVTVAKGSMGDRSYKATWTINKYKVTFKDYNGDVLVAEAEYEYDSDLSGIAPNMADKTNADGAPFGGWDNDYTGKVPAFDVVYTAVYGGTFTLKFVLDGVTIQSGEVDYNTAITAPESPEKEGYDFMGWKDQIGKDFTEYNGKMPAKNVTFTAQWKAKQYTVTFILNNGSDNIVYTQDYGSQIVAPEDPVKTGHTFKGWTPEVATTVPAQNLTYEATYQVNTYKVIYMVYGEEWARDQYTYDSPIVIRQYVGTILDDFRGWQSDAEYTTMPDHDVTYVADITKLEPIVITNDMIQNIDDKIYTGSAIEPTITVKNGELTLVEGTDYSISYTDNINVGTAKVTVTAIQGSCYQGTANKTFTIVKADVIVNKAPVGLNLVYTGQPQALVEAGSVEGGTILYSADGESYSEVIPVGTEMQDYTVYYKIIGDANHNDMGVQTLTASIKGFPVVVGAGEYVTYYCDRALKLDAAETDAKLYTVTEVNGTVVTVSELTVAAAYTPILVYNNSVEAKTVVLVPTDDAPENIDLYSGFKGTLAAQQMDGSSDAKDYYVLAGQYFVKVRNAGIIAANRCWLEVNKNVSQSAPRLTIGGGNGTTGLNVIDNEQLTNDNYYDLNGRKLQGKPAQKGVYIQNGKKVVIK